MNGQTEHSPAEGSSSSSNNKRKRIWAACEPCRKRKSKCDGQSPCGGCVSTIKTAMLPINTTNFQNVVIDENLVQSKAQELCVFDWNRKPRGPKGKKAAFAAAFGVDTSTGVGAPRSHTSAGKAYMDAQKRAMDESQAVTAHGHQPSSSASNSNNSSFVLTPPDEKTSTAAVSTSREVMPRAWADAHHHSHPHYQHNGSASSSNGGGINNSIGSISTSNYVFDRPEMQHRESNESSTFSEPSPVGPYGRAPQSASSSTLFSPTDVPGSTYTRNGSRQEYFGVDDRVSKASLSAWDAIADASHHLRSNSVSSMRQSQQSNSTSPADPNRVGASPSYSQGSGGLAAVSPHSDGSNSYLNTALKFSPGHAAESPDSRYHDQSMLINRLKPYYSDKDRPFVALAISQFEALDSFEKMVPSRYLFGSAPGSAQARDPPAHVLLALLAFLAHRALLLPDSMNVEDLDLQAGELVLRCANNYCRLEGDDRKQMLNFARRSWSLANDLMLQKIRSGEVDPRLIMTGMLLEMGAGEDGLSSKGLAQRKLWLFRLVYCWRLHQLDAKPESESWNTPWEGPEVVQQSLEITGASNADDPRAPLPKVADARGLIKDPIELEAIRRQVSLIVTAAYWVQTFEMQVPKFDIHMLELDPANADDFIHHGSNWTPKVHAESNGYLTQTRDLIFRTYGRVNRLLHTPLADICTGHSPEPDLQHAITEMETTLDWLMDRVGTVTYDGPEMPLRVAAFIHSRLCVLFMSRLFVSIQAFFYLFPERTTAKTNKSLRIASTMMPKNETRSNFDLISGGTTIPESESEDDSAATRDFQGRPLLPRPHFSRHPMKASMAMLYETGALAKRLLALHRARDAALEPVEGRRISDARMTTDVDKAEQEAGNSVGKTMDASLRAVRWPRHLRMFAQHAYAMAAESHAAGSSWSSTWKDESPKWKSPASFNLLPPFNDENIESGLWDIGDTFLELLEEMAKMGSTHAKNNEEATLRYRQERWNWSKRYRAQNGQSNAMPNPQ
ncbi:hypothetical protein BCV70DRAFT_175284 [Testicularia cyperi]|uniref:Zn(2)-C6 fungal-type domain-containing protein n=1 Tax=Testicularia cyperi TaxID=1882483 RepID=A0A317XTX6_9BASI|nr:hypothetical protein BCV70DRAFT_175284 [Testicularia cyperi]